MPKKTKKRSRDIELLFEISALRYIPRVWQHFLNDDVANVAEHTLRVVWIALFLAHEEGIHNSDEKIVKMALLHDIAESRTGDANYVSRHYTKRDEERANQEILKDSFFETEGAALLKEYSDRASAESKIVKDADNIDVDLELQEMETRGLVLGKIFKRERKERLPKVLYTKSALRLWQAIRKSDPHAWHLHARKHP